MYYPIHCFDFYSAYVCRPAKLVPQRDQYGDKLVWIVATDGAECTSKYTYCLDPYAATEAPSKPTAPLLDETLAEVTDLSYYVGPHYPRGGSETSPIPLADALFFLGTAIIIFAWMAKKQA